MQVREESVKISNEKKNPLSMAFRSLGAPVALSRAPRTSDHTRARFEKAAALAGRIGQLPISFEQKGMTLASLVMSAGLFAIEVSFVSQTLLRSLERAVLQAVWGRSRITRAKEVLFAVILPGHRLSPFMATDYSRIM